MSRKHKKHHKSDKEEKSQQDEKPLKLVLKVGTSSAEKAPEPVSSERKHKHKKKKKKSKDDKKDRDKEKEKHHKHHKREKEQETSETTTEETKVSRSDRLKEKENAESELEAQQEKKDLESKVSTDKRERTVKKRELEEKPEVDNKEPPAKKALFGEEQDFISQIRSQRQKEEKTVLQKSLEYMHNILQRKDVNAFFSYPVTDSIAPGYSSIIKEPMDFSTMKLKIDNNEYTNFMEYRHDFNIMCENCMVYNQPETIFYKEAMRLKGMAAKQLSKEKLIQMRKNLPLMVSLTDEELGLESEIIDVDSVDHNESTPTKQPLINLTRTETPKPKSTMKFEAIMDDMSPEEILAQAQSAAKEAAAELSLRKPNSKFGFLKRKKDGTTTLNILNPDNNGIVSEKERVVSLGKLTGKLASGAGSLAGFREDKRNKATPVTYLSYGPYSSYAPTYDSSFATLSKEDSDILLSTYGDETGIQYAKSLKDYVADAGEFATRMVDSLLSILTQNLHSKATKIFEEKNKEESEKKQKEKEEYERRFESDGNTEDAEQSIDLDSLKSLSDIGIDMSFLDNFGTSNKYVERTEKEIKIDEQLDKSAQLLGELEKTQHERLSLKLPSHLAMVPGPSITEKTLANKVTSELTNLAKQVTPGDIASTKAIHNAIGISYNPSEIIEVKEESNEEEAKTSLPSVTSQTQSEFVETPVTEVTTDNEDQDLEQLMESPPPVQEENSQHENMEIS